MICIKPGLSTYKRGRVFLSVEIKGTASVEYLLTSSTIRDDIKYSKRKPPVREGNHFVR